MPRKTSLKLLSERPAVNPGDVDERSVIEAFPSPPARIPENDLLAADVLEILKKSHDRIEGKANLAAATADEAILRVDNVASRIVDDGRRLDEVTAKVVAVEERAASDRQVVLNEVTGLLNADRVQAKRIAAAGLTAALDSIAARLVAALVFVIERAPVMLSLLAAIWLWNRILPDPKPLQLVALGLFGAVVIAPSIWLGKFRGS